MRDRFVYRAHFRPNNSYTEELPAAPRVVSLTADPAPVRFSGSTRMIASVAGPEVEAKPAAITDMKATMRPQYAESTDEPDARTNPALMSIRPVATTRAVPKLSH